MECNRFEVCIVDDELGFRKEIQDCLQLAGYGVRAFSGSRELYASLLGGGCDVVILDAGLPGEEGFSVLKTLQQLRPPVGVVMLAELYRSEDKVRGLQEGADAYLVKPVVQQEVLAVLASLLRRLRPGQAESGIPVGERAKGGGGEMRQSWSLSDDSWTLTGPDGKSVHLTAQERLFMLRLLQTPGEAVAREALVLALGENVYDYDFHRLDALVSRLRRKVSDAGATLPLRAVRGKGYLFLPCSERRSE
ncbi:response regulator transcription factor [Azovibrio restrictus]|uniref:response regulator transcription factor n=1 Tax=Azovibrio restrictus TaxID=146938 RepID=UPI0026EC2CAA|nr:response regulator transcription factor [Azovibrio restrictus]MDD3482490.1 response regulator transcription factor [Azovibrio restrictus]